MGEGSRLTSVIHEGLIIENDRAVIGVYIHEKFLGSLNQLSYKNGYTSTMNPKNKKLCPRCKEIKPIEDFWKWKNGKDGHQNWCKPCLLLEFVLTKITNSSTHPTQASHYFASEIEKSSYSVAEGILPYASRL